MTKKIAKKKMTALLFALLLAGLGIYALTLLWGRLWPGASDFAREEELYDAYYVLIEDGHDSTLWNSIYEGARKEGEESCNAYVEYMGKNLTTNYTVQEKLRIAIDAGVDGIILNGGSSEETDRLLEEAVNKGIPVVTALDDSAYNLRKCFVGVNNYILGQEYSRLCWEILSENPKDSRVVVLMDSASTGTGKNTMFWGMKETIDEKLQEAGWNYEIKVQAISIDSSNAFMTEEAIRKLLVTEEEHPDILICLSETDTRRAYEAVVDYIKVGEVYILGYYKSETILDAIQKKIISSTVVVDGEQLGSLCIKALKEYRETGYVNGYFPVETYIIDENNVASYLVPEGI